MFNGSKYKIRGLIALILVIAFCFSTQLKAVEKSFGLKSSIIQLSSVDIQKVLKKIAGIGKSRLVNYDYYYGFLFKREEREPVYKVSIFKNGPIRTFKDVWRLDGDRYTIEGDFYQSGECNSLDGVVCRFERIQYASLCSDCDGNINDYLFRNFLELRHDFEDVVLSHLLEIAKIPLTDIVNDTDAVLLKNKYNVSVDEDLRYVCNPVTYKCLTMMSEEVDFLLRYEPKAIDLKRAANGRREYAIYYSPKKDADKLLGLILTIRQNDLEGSRYDIFITRNMLVF